MAFPMSDYEKRRQANIADNKRILAALGLLNPESDRPTLELILNIKKRKPEADSVKEPPKKRVKKDKVIISEVDPSLGFNEGGVRRSSRRRNEPARYIDTDLPLDDEDEENDGIGRAKPKLKAPPNRENFYGPIPGVEIGAAYETRLEFCVVGVHRPTVAGIHGGPDGAYSIALSGGYEDDIDRGEFFTYTGEGGRDLKGTPQNRKNLRTAPQSKDQTLTRGNLALSRSAETGKPVRVIRGYKLKSPYAPETGYRYDGLYTVEKSWFTTGLSGFNVWKFAMKRCEDQPPPPWKYIDENANVEEEESTDKLHLPPEKVDKEDDLLSSDSDSEEENIQKSDDPLKHGAAAPKIAAEIMETEDTEAENQKTETETSGTASNVDTNEKSDQPAEIQEEKGDGAEEGDSESDKTATPRSESESVESDDKNLAVEVDESPSNEIEEPTTVGAEDGDKIRVETTPVTAAEASVESTDMSVDTVNELAVKEGVCDNVDETADEELPCDNVDETADEELPCDTATEVISKELSCDTSVETAAGNTERETVGSGPSPNELEN